VPPDRLADAAVPINDTQALVGGTELIAALVIAPEELGAIAAANALVALCASGAQLVLASTVAIRPDSVDNQTLVAIWDAAGGVVREAGGRLLDGPTIRGGELLVGLSVQGLVDRRRRLPAGEAEAGDVLVLSKPIGTGIVMAGGDDRERAGAISGMRLTNRIASERLIDIGDDCHAVTGVMGDGLVGHGHELAERSGVRVVFESSMVPCYRGAKARAGDGIRAVGEGSNRDVLHGKVSVDSSVDGAVEALVFDPQTSGGLLAAVEPGAVDELVEAGFRPIGTVVDPLLDDEGYSLEPLVQLM
jgi:selenide,water dikinase